MIALLFGLGLLKADAVSVTMSGHGPQNELIVAKPTIVWQVWPDGDNVVSAATISVDGKKQKASYSKLAKSLLFTPEQPFKPGEHQVLAQIVVNGWAKFDKKWSFSVLPDAYTELPSPTEASRAVVDSFNEIREIGGLEPTVIDPRLCLAAIGHSTYLEKYPGAGHLQKPSKPGFTGREPAERLARVGFSGGSWEVLVPSVDDVDIAVKRLFDAPYHRVSMLNSGPIKVGGGYIGGTVVIDGEASSEIRTVVSPTDGQKNVQPFWKDSEIPDPFRLHTVTSKLVGYPIMFVRQGAQKIVIRSFRLTDPDGNRVDVYENFPGYDDHLDAEAFIMPKKPLNPSTTYRVTVEAIDDKKKDIGRSWSFTTADSGLYSARTVSSLQDALGIAQAPVSSLLRRR
ncbi:MAG: CAP domain-containing protein [Armatimonadota bacterium]